MATREAREASDTQGTEHLLARAAADCQRVSASLAALASDLSLLDSMLSPQASSPLAGAYTPQLPLTSEQEPDIRVNLFGTFRLVAGGLDLPSDLPAQARTILAYLVSHRKHFVSRDALIELLWPDTPPDVAGSRLRVLMHVLRKMVPCTNLGLHELVVSANSHFQISPQARLWVDVEEFEHRWQDGWRLARAGHIADAMAEYEQAEALYAGDYLEDEPYADWTLLPREGLRDAYTTILTMLVSMSLHGTDYAGAIIWAQKLLVQDNCREDAYQALIISHQHLGQHARAACWYDLCARTLSVELGIQPSEETQALARK